ncbi:MAG TPA: GlsB/YeaQ/YmgE family stress response membrane protein, partial [Thermomicrobiales bacterium]|nr:GlsB/YeaQ/YmgE family stress response membrane protein [Thermomicrobiales bacterium]
GGELVDFIIWLIIGLIAGALAMFVVFRTIPREPASLVGALVVGLLGGILGGWVSDLIGLDAVSWLGSIVVAFAGAFVILWLINRMMPGRGQRSGR